MRRVNFPVSSIVLYVLAGLFALYTIWAAIYSFGYVSEMIAANQLVISGNEFEVMNFLMTNFAQYAVFAVILFALGRILQVYASGRVAEENQASSFEEVADEDTDEDNLEDLEQNDDE